MAVEEGLNEGDHAAIVIDLDMESALGKSALWQDIEAETKKAQESNMNAVFMTIQLKKPERVIAFQEAVVGRWPEGGKLDRRILAFSKEVEAKRARGDASVDWEAVRQAGDKLMDEAVGALLAAQDDVHRTLPKAGSNRAYTKHVMTPEMVKKADSLRPKTEVVKGWSLGWRKNLDKTKVKVGRLLETASRKRVWTLGSELLRKAPGPEKGFRTWQGFIDKD
jgi:hypothetical protein